MNTTLTAEKIREIFDTQGAKGLRETLEEMHPADLADLLEELEGPIQIVAFRSLHKDFAAETFSHMSGNEREELFNGLGEAEGTELLTRLETDDAVDFLEELPANAVQRLLHQVPPNRRQLLNDFLKYPPESAGSVMMDMRLRFPASMKIAEAIERLRSDETVVSSIGALYVTSANLVLVGVLTFRDLLKALDDMLLEDAMDPQFYSIHTLEDQQEAVRMIQHYDLPSLPVTDSEGRFVGVITIDDAMDIAEMEASEDMELMAGVKPQDASYRDTSAFEQAKARLPWLLILLVSGLFNGAILGQFEAAFVAVPVLVTFIPMLTDTGGNAGSQSSTLIIRGLATEEISVHDLGYALLKELKVALMVALPMFFIVVVRCLVLPPHDLWIGIVTGLAMCAIIVMSKLLGTLLPIVSQKIGLDPALMAGPLITTAVDAGGLLIFFGLATWLLGL